MQKGIRAVDIVGQWPYILIIDNGNKPARKDDDNDQN